ncbi:hypothetical protein K491DRAFT_690163 [Lophiostoma macrostomum CBS 122681]|uniref:Pal1-domain-containing protein n=1 Tax=Lophiostoma macrostomum CBS 122681 TaxID=1314788 RepID=A0A6A6THL9_9PLEO|nr:hypothetical protein K491DRAFT_690163 [Lophiostoma macrostomum CBS 122681]
MSSYQPKRYSSHRVQRLPSEEHAYLSSKARLESHFRSSRTFEDYAGSTRSFRSSSSSGSFRSQEQRLRDSETRYATRSALSKGADYGREEAYAYADGEYAQPIPKKYLDDVNRMMYEDDFADDADQYKAGLTRGAVGRKHRSAGTEDVQDMMRHLNLYDEAYGADSARRMPQYKESKDRRPVPMVGDAVTPLKSQFDWDSSSDEDEDEDEDEVARPGKLHKRKSVLRKRRS